jgi:MFS family permease
VTAPAFVTPAFLTAAVGAGLTMLASLGPLTRAAGLPALPFLGLIGLLGGAAHGFLYPALSALVMDLTPEGQRGRVIGVFSAFILAGQALGALVFGPVAHAVGYPAMFGVLAVLLGGGVRSRRAARPLRTGGPGSRGGARRCILAGREPGAVAWRPGGVSPCGSVDSDLSWRCS